jgi:aminopeptidase N
VVAVVENFNNSWVNNYIVNLLTPMARKKQDKASTATGDTKAALNKQAEYIQQVAKKIKENTKNEE